MKMLRMAINDTAIAVLAVALAGCAAGGETTSEPGPDAGFETDVPALETTEQAPARVEEIAANEEIVCARLADGRVFCWGDLATNGCLDPTFARTPRPTLIPELSHRGIVAMSLHGPNCALHDDGGVSCWGTASDAEMGRGEDLEGTCHPPARVPIDGVQELGTGYRHACALRGGEVWCWGNNISFQSRPDWEFGNGDVPVPMRVEGVGKARRLAVSQPTCALLDDGSVACWGADPWRSEDASRPSSPRVVEGLTGVTGIVGVFSGGGFARTEDDQVLHFRSSMRSTVSPPDVIGELAGSRRLFGIPWQEWRYADGSGGGGGSDYVVGLDVAGVPRIHAWQSTRFNVEATLAGLTNVRVIAIAQTFLCVVVGDEDVIRCGGRNSHGQLGDGTYVDRMASLQPVLWPKVVR